MSYWTTRNWNLLNGVFLYNTGRPIRSLSFREVLDLAYAYLTKNLEAESDFQRFDRILNGTARPEDFPTPEKVEKLSPDTVNLGDLDSLDALYRAPTIEPMTGGEND